MKILKYRKFIIFFIITILPCSCSNEKNKKERNKTENISTTSSTSSKAEENKETSFSEKNMENVILNIKKDKEDTDKDRTLTAKEIDLENSTEGGIRTYYYKGDLLKKIVEENFGENGKFYKEYYIKNNKIYFSYEVYTLYNAPIFMTKKLAEKEGVGEYFDPSKSLVEEKRYYFDEQENLIRYIDENGKLVKNMASLKSIENEFKSKITFNN